MSRIRQNIEDFLREKLEMLEAPFQDDWNVFERKLRRALFWRRVRTGSLTAVVALLIGVSWISLYDTNQDTGDYYTKRDGNIDQKLSAKQVVEMPIQNAASSLKVKAEEAFSEKKLTSAISSPALSTIELNPETTSSEESNLAIAGNSEKASGNLIASNNPAVFDTKKILSPSTFGEQEIEVEEKDKIAEDAKKEKIISENSTAGVDPKESTEDLSKELVAQLTLKTPGLDQQRLEDVLEAPVRLQPPSFSFTIAPVKKEAYVSPNQSENPWSFALNVYPNYTFRKFKVDNDKRGYIHEDFIDEVKTAERGGFSLNVGFEVNRRIGRITYLNSGLEYISYKTKTQFDFQHYREAIINEGTGKISHYNLLGETQQIAFSEDNVYHYLNIPLSISHQPWATDHIQLNIEAGGSFMYFLTAKGRTLNYQTLEVIDLKSREYRKSIGAFFMKVGATYHVSQRFNLGLEPTLMYFTNTIYTEEYPFQVIPYSVGVNLKLQMKLN